MDAELGLDVKATLGEGAFLHTRVGVACLGLISSPVDVGPATNSCARRYRRMERRV